MDQKIENKKYMNQIIIARKVVQIVFLLFDVRSCSRDYVCTNVFINHQPQNRIGCRMRGRDQQRFAILRLYLVVFDAGFAATD